MSDNENLIDTEPIYIEIEESNILERRALRTKLLNSFLNKRQLDSILNYKLWPDLQHSDEDLKLIFMYLQKNNKLLSKSTDENKLWIPFKENNKQLYNNTINGNIKINDYGILEIKRKSDLTDEDEYVAIVPSIIRDKLVAYTHNNPTTQHFAQTSTYDNSTQWWW